MRQLIIRYLAVIGSVVVVQSIFWEYARMKPDYAFIVEPWSMRGTDSIHGAVVATIGVALLIAAAAVIWERATEPAPRVVLTVLLVITPIVIAAVFGNDSVSMTMNGLVVTVSALIIAVVVARLLARPLSRLGGWMATGFGMFAAWLVSAGILFAVLQASVGDDEVTIPIWLLVAIPTLLAAALSLGSAPMELAANRMLIYVVMLSGLVVTVSAGAMRSTLLRFQLEQTNIAAQYKDVQVTSGWFLAQAGILLAFVGAVAMWARRRDLILTRQRARHQREAAEKSAQEIEAALAAAE